MLEIIKNNPLCQLSVATKEIIGGKSLLSMVFGFIYAVCFSLNHIKNQRITSN